MQATTLTFTGKTVKLATVYGLLKTLPMIEVKVNELARENRYATRVGESNHDESKEEISVFKFESHYIVITGKPVVELFLKTGKPIFKARFITKQAFKHMQTIEKPAPVYPAYEAPRPHFMREPNYQQRPYDRQEGRYEERRPFVANAMTDAFNKR